MNESIIRNVKQYERIYWLKKISEWNRACDIFQNIEEEAIIIKKQKLIQPPDPPSNILDYIEGVFDNPEKAPRLKESKLGELKLSELKQNDAYNNLEDSILDNEYSSNNNIDTLSEDTQIKKENKPTYDNSIKEAFNTYIEDWKIWSQRVLPQYNIQKIYNEFFDLYLKFENSNDDYELILGQGLLVWNYNGENIVHPLITKKIELEFNAKNGYFTLNTEERASEIELYFLENLNLPNMDKVVEIKNNFNENEIQDTRAFSNIAPKLNEILNLICPQYEHPEGQIDNELKDEDYEIQKWPKIYNSPVIILRKRNTRQWISELNNIINSIDNGYKIPETIKSLASDDVFMQDEITQMEWEDCSKELLFPLPANEEQKEIARRISNNYGVCVQGPPGTGKSHTIANLLCHLLANGKRVLVTSQTDKALKVLADKIPEDIRSLCISVVGNDRRSVKEIEESVRKITEHLADDPETLNQYVENYKNQINSCNERLETLYNKLKQAEIIENEPILYEEKEYRLMDIAKWVNENEKEYSYISDSISMDQRAVIAEGEFAKILYLLNDIDKNDIEEYEKINTIINKIPDYDKISSLLIQYKELDKDYTLYVKRLEKWEIPGEPHYDFETLLRFIDEAKEKLHNVNNSWIKNVMDYYYSSDMAKNIINSMLDKSIWSLSRISELKNNINSYRIETPDNINIDKLNEIFLSVYNELLNKGKIGTLYKLINNKQYAIFESLSVDGRKITDIKDANILKDYIDYKLLIKNISNIWNNTVKDFGGIMLDEGSLLSIIDFEKNVELIKTAVNWNEIYKKKISALFGDVIIPRSLNFYEEETYELLHQALLDINNLMKHKELEKEIDYLISDISIEDEMMIRLTEAIKDYNLDTIKAVCDYIDHIKEIEPDIKELYSLFEKLKDTCPAFVQKLISEAGQGNLIEKYKDFNTAWKWKKFNTFLQEKFEIRPEAIEAEIFEQKEVKNSLIRKMISRKTWYNQIRRTTEQQKRSLFSWMSEIKRIGKGTGKYASYHIKAAQKEMETSRDAIPVWIMPISRVIENFKLTPDFDLFDVVIVDESSQSDMFALSALIRAKKAVIVGDDKQITPQDVGRNQDAVHAMILKYLKDIPHYQSFDMQMSLYETALRVFPNRLMLKEHFRCVPEIIKFSNDLCYNGEIIPLRHASSKEIFTPSLVDVFVDNGYKEDNKQLNIPEAEAIIDKIALCIKDEAYNNMSFGVISLLGRDQAEYIQNRLKEVIGEEEYIRRHIICGDSYSFQGDERDIMFLSLVIAENAKYTSLTKDSDIRRFNVAASRARNQMWLFHSVELNKVNESCVRYKLLSYYRENRSSIIDLKENSNVTVTQLEMDVKNALIDIGLRVKTRVKVGKHRIDLVIEGEKSRLAIVCDGDRWQGIERWEIDHERQEQLERVGWTFCIVRGSEFYRYKNKVMERIIYNLEKLGIEKSDLKVVIQNKIV